MSHPASASPPGDRDASPSSTTSGRPSACDPCRKSKKRCDNQRPACGRCLRYARPCTQTCIKTGNISEAKYDAVRAERDELIAKRDALVAERDDLRGKLTEYEETFRALAAERNALIADRDTLERKLTEYEEAARGLSCALLRPTAPSTDSRTQDHALGTEFNQLRIGRSGSGQGPHFLNAQAAEGRTSKVVRSSTDSLLQLLSDARRGGRLHDTSARPGIPLKLPPPTASLYSIVPSRTTVAPNVTLPLTKEAAWLLFEDQFTYIGTIFAFADRASFQQLLDEVYDGRLDVADPASCLAHAKLLVILAFGEFYSINQQVRGGGLPGSEYFAAAVQLLPEIHEHASVRFVETLSLVGYFMQNLNHRAAAFSYVGLAVRMAISLGLHEEAPVPGPDGAALPEKELEYRRRVWWSVYSMDRILTVKSGNPVMIHDEDISVAMPARLPSEPEYCPAVVLASYTELSRILGHIHKRIYSPRLSSSPSSEPHKAMHELTGTLRRWEADIPPQLKFDVDRLSYTRESVSTLLHFYQCINMMVRPLVYTLVRRRSQGSAEDRARDWREGLPEATHGIIVWCIDSARDTIHLMAIANRQRLVANYGYMDTEHALSAAILLLMGCAAFPPDPANTASLRDALELLARMGHRGNHHIGARCQVLRQLAAEFVPGLLPREPVPDGAAAHGPSDVLLDTVWDEFLEGMDGMASMPFGPVALGYDQSVWNGVMDNVMRD